MMTMVGDNGDGDNDDDNDHYDDDNSNDDCDSVSDSDSNSNKCLYTSILFMITLIINTIYKMNGISS